MDVIGRYRDTFCNAAIKKSDGDTTDDAALFNIMTSSYSRLHKHPNGAACISALLNHESDYVRSWVAAQVLSEYDSQKAIDVLKEITNKGGVLGFSTEMTLSQFEKGELQSPFGIRP